MWLKSWAFATSPYGLGLTTEESWKLTPREFHELELVYQAHRKDVLDRWASERSHFFNAHFNPPHGERNWTPGHFIKTPEAKEEADDLSAHQVAHAWELQTMKAGVFDESSLPVWARMTPEEKRAKGK